MAAPRRWEHGVGRVEHAAPTAVALRLVQETGDFAGYRTIVEDRFARLAANGRHCPVGHDFERGNCLRIDDPLTGEPVLHGDSLLCGCAAPGSPRRTHPCHVELLAPFLVRAGWDVVLWGQRLTLATSTVGPTAGQAVAVYADGDRAGEPYDPADYGWPEAA